MVMRPGQRFGSFEILEHLGSGSFGHVYKVNDPGMSAVWCMVPMRGP